MSLGIVGRILNIDLSSSNTWIETLNPSMVRRYLGSRGMNARILWERIRAGIDPLGPENVLIFGTGTLTGTSAPTSGRMTITCKSPATGLYVKSNVGGHWATELKFAGYDYVVIQGRAPGPVYIWIDDSNVEIHSADQIWGKDVRETTETLLKALGDQDIQVACIGPAGENLVYFAGIMCSVYSGAARGGVGAVMGSKNLKAIAVRGTGEIHVARPQEYYQVVQEAIRDLYSDPSSKTSYLYGTSGSVPVINEMNAFPSYNFKSGHIEGGENISGQYLAEAGYLKKRIGCNACIFSCHRYCEVNSGKYAGTYTGGPEYETMSSLGAGCGTTDVEVVIKAGELCNIYGLDTISAGSVIQWAMETYEKGLITERETDGLKLDWGNGDVVIELIKRIAYRDGFGAVLADGVKKAAHRIGQGSERWALEAKGLEQSRVETRSAFGYALGFAVNPRGPDHLHTSVMAELGIRPGARRLVKKLTGDEKYANPLILEKRAELVRWHEDCYAVTDSLGFCAFATLNRYGVDPNKMARMFSSAFGEDISEDELMLAGRRIINLEKCINVREGTDRSFDKLPYRLMNEPLESRARGKDVISSLAIKYISGERWGTINSKEMLDKMLDEYYQLHGWDKETSWPTQKTLRDLGLEDCAEVLKKMGKKLK